MKLAKPVRNKQEFPLIPLSAGIAMNTTRPFSHYGEMTEVASQMKNDAKMSAGSGTR